MRWRTSSLFDIIPSLYVIFTQSAWPLVICLFQSVSSKAICPSVSSIATFVFYTRNLLLLKRGLLVEGNSLGRVDGQGWHLEREVHTSRWKKTHISQNGGRTFFEINNFSRSVYFDKFFINAFNELPEKFSPFRSLTDAITDKRCFQDVTSSIVYMLCIHGSFIPV